LSSDLLEEVEIQPAHERTTQQEAQDRGAKTHISQRARYLAHRANRRQQRQEERGDADEGPEITPHQRPAAAQATANVQIIISGQDLTLQRLRVGPCTGLFGLWTSACG